VVNPRCLIKVLALFQIFFLRSNSLVCFRVIFSRHISNLNFRKDAFSNANFYFTFTSLNCSHSLQNGLTWKAVKAAIAKIVIEEIRWPKIWRFTFRSEYWPKDISVFHAQKKNNLDNLSPQKALWVDQFADITQNSHRLIVVNHPLNPPLQSSLTQHLPDKSMCQSE
jgi:hypothetical protein